MHPTLYLLHQDALRCNTDYVTVQKKPVTTILTYPWKCTVLHCNHLGNTWKPLVLMTRHFDYCPSASEPGDNQSVRSSAPVVSRCFPGGYNVKLYISRGRLAWWLLAFFAQCVLYSTCFSPFLCVVIEGKYCHFTRTNIYYKMLLLWHEDWYLLL